METTAAYSSRLTQIQQQAKAYTEAAIRAFQAINPDASLADLEDYAATVLDSAVQVYGGAGGQAAIDRYNKQMEKMQIDTEEPELDFGVADTWAKNTVDAVTQGAVTAEEIANRVADKAFDVPRRAANETTRKAATRDQSKGVRYARVPTGRETCGFCLMLASQGFVYRTAKTAALNNHNHSHCDCTVEAGNEGTQIAGYDPDHYLKVYYDAVNSVQDENGFVDYGNVCREIERRERGWAWHGNPVSPMFASDATSEQRSIGNVLAEHGISSTWKVPAKQAEIKGKVNGRIWDNVSISDASDFKDAVSGHERVIVDARGISSDKAHELIKDAENSRCKEVLIISDASENSEFGTSVYRIQNN